MRSSHWNHFLLCSLAFFNFLFSVPVQADSDEISKKAFDASFVV